MHSIIRPAVGVCCAALVLLPFAAASARPVIYVDDSAAPGGDGSSWNSAYRSLRTALQQAGAGDQVRVGQGTYRPAAANGNRAKSFVIADGVTVRGGYAGVGAANPNLYNPAQFPTILTGDLNGNDNPSNASTFSENSYHVVLTVQATNGIHLRGLVICGGNADSPDSQSSRSRGGALLASGGSKVKFTQCVIEGNRAYWLGGGVHAGSGKVTMVSCTVRTNRTLIASSGAGGGAWVKRGRFTNCLFENNQAGIGSTGGGGLNGQTVVVINSNFHSNSSGGVICGDDSLIRGCQFQGNGAEDGGGIFVTGQGVAVIECAFVGNGAASYGGGLFVHFDAAATILNSRFMGNGSSGGSAVFNRGSLSMVNCFSSGNHLPFSGAAGTIVSTGQLSMVNCTIAHNSCAISSAAVISSGSGAEVISANCIVWSNDSGGNGGEQAQVRATGGGIMTLSHCCVDGWSGAAGGPGGNFGDDPLLIDPAGPDGEFGTADDDFTLAADSPCRDAGHNSSLPSDSYDLDGDGNTSEPVALDLAGQPRIVNQTVDVGAQELPEG